jgi:hypothetical protein
MHKNIILNTIFLMTITLLLGCNSSGKTIYVNANASPGGNGTTWQKAYKNLQDALDNAVTGDEIWVMAGIYKPSIEIGESGDRYKSFRIKNGIALYGGFVGTETSREQRDWQVNETILSGDHNGDDTGFSNNGENSYHVVTGNNTDSTALLDGFTITAGNANFDVWPDDGGGGMNNHDGSPTIRNCTFKSNAAFADGGGMRNWGDYSKPIIINCKFIGNSADQEGGGMMNGPGSKPIVFNCKFFSNSAGEDGGGMYNNESFNSLIVNCVFSSNSARLTGGGMYNVNESSPKVINCTFNNNAAKSAGGAMCNNNGYPILVNCILWGNSAPDDQEIHNIGPSTPVVSYSNISGGYKGTGNIDADPLFTDENLRLSAGSKCVDTGDNSAVPAGVTTDLNANQRILNGIVDMGAFEFEQNVKTGIK